MRPLLLAGLLTALLVPATAFAAAPPSIVESTRLRIEAVIKGDGPQDEENEEMPAWTKTPKPAMFKQVDANGDKLPDWQVSYDKAPIPSYFCGTGGCSVEIWIGKPDGTYAKALDLLVREFKLSGPKTNRIIDVDFHGSVCSGYGVEACPRRYGWDAAGGRYLERPNKDGGTLLRFGPVPTLKTTLQDAPPEVLASLDQRAATCAKVGAAYLRDEGGFTEIPDINGDGKRDWVVGSWDQCTFTGDIPDDAPRLPLTVLVTGSGGMTTALEKTGIGWELDIATEPARFIAVEDSDGDSCSTEEHTCPRTPMTFNATTGKLEVTK